MAQSMSAKAAVGSSIHRWLMKTNDNSIMAYINGAQYVWHRHLAAGVSAKAKENSLENIGASKIMLKRVGSLAAGVMVRRGWPGNGGIVSWRIAA
jgi:hypothetical protein